LKNVGPGYYYLYAIHGGTCIYPYFVSLEDKTHYIDTSQINIKQPSCGLFNGFINGLIVYNGSNSTKKWVDESGNVIGTENYLNQLGQGTYRYIVTDTVVGGGCSDTATFVLVNQSGPSLDLTGLSIKPATCGNKNGSITGIKTATVNGTPFIEWRDSTGSIAGNSLDIINLGEGKYRLYFKDDTGCDTIITPFFTIKDSAAISINEASVIIEPTGCLTNSGSISGVMATNTSTYTWKNFKTNSIVGNTLNVAALGAGTYQLTASNTAGCTAVSSVISIATANFDAIQVKTFDKKDASCNNADGSIAVTSFDKDATGYTFRWTDSALNQPVTATNNIISDLGKGNYQLFATDKYGCEKKIFSAFVDSFPTPDLDFSAMQIASDLCKTGKGSITGIKVINLRGAATYQWLDANNTSVGIALNLNNAVAGTYYIHIQDSHNCGASSSAIIIPDDVNASTQPVYEDITVMKNATAVLGTENYEAGEYLLFADPAGTQLLQQNKTGIFNIERVAEDRSVFVQRITGTCKSQLVRVNIKAVERSYFIVPKAFSPNDDLLNDRIGIKVSGSLRLSYFKIYNRFGQLVFETQDLNTPWDGKFKFMKQPGGAYVWLAEGKDILGNVVNANGSIVLIR
jgi:gliding motility-associated-like protein